MRPWWGRLIRCVGSMGPARGSLRRAGRWALAAWFLVSSLGLPLGAHAGDSCCETRLGVACQCSASKRLAGECCCKKPVPKPQPAPSKSCCSERKSDTIVVKAAAEKAKRAASCCSKSDEDQTAKWPALRSCPCGTEAGGIIVLNQQPRLAASSLAAPLPSPGVVISDARRISFLSQRPVPPVPPPIVLF